MATVCLFGTTRQHSSTGSTETDADVHSFCKWGPPRLFILLTGVTVMKRLVRDRAIWCYTEAQSWRKVGLWKKRSQRGCCARKFKGDRDTKIVCFV
jgi:hypothetical protein